MITCVILYVDSKGKEERNRKGTPTCLYSVCICIVPSPPRPMEHHGREGRKMLTAREAGEHQNEAGSFGNDRPTALWTPVVACTRSNQIKPVSTPAWRGKLLIVLENLIFSGYGPCSSTILQRMAPPPGAQIRLFRLFRLLFRNRLFTKKGEGCLWGRTAGLTWEPKLDP